MSTSNKSYTELAQAKRAVTGSFGSGLSLRTDPGDTSVFNTVLELSSSALTRNVPAMFQLWHEVLTSFAPDKEHLRTMLAMMAVRCVAVFFYHS